MTQQKRIEEYTKQEIAGFIMDVAAKLEKEVIVDVKRTKKEDLIAQYRTLKTELKKKQEEAQMKQQAKQSIPVDQLQAIIAKVVAEATAPFKKQLDELIEENKRLQAELDARESLDTLVQSAPAVASAQPVEEDPIRVEYIKRREAFYQAKKEFDSAIKSGNSAAIHAASAKFQKAERELFAMQGDMSIRERIVDFFDNTAEAVRTHGHRGVDAVADILVDVVNLGRKGGHAVVDGTASIIQATGGLIRGKQQPTAPVFNAEPRIV